MARGRTARRDLIRLAGGTIVKANVLRGTYHSETPAVGFDPRGPNDSQGYITEVTARAVIPIQADNPRIERVPMTGPSRTLARARSST